MSSFCFKPAFDNTVRYRTGQYRAGKDLLSPERVARVGKRLKLVIGIVVAGSLVRVKLIEDWLQFGRANITEPGFPWLNG